MFLNNIIFVLIVISGSVCYTQARPKKRLMIISVNTDHTDGYLLYVRSLRVYGLVKNARTLASGQNYTGHALKIKLLKQELEKYKDRGDVIVLFTDSFDVLITAGENQIIRTFETFKANIVFSAETNCWPNELLSKFYPEVKVGYRYLNSGGFIGYAPDIYDMLPEGLNENFDDQLYYTFAFLDEKFRTNLNMVLDTQAKLFQSLHGAKDHVSLLYTEDDTKLINHYTNSTPAVLHGNGNGKMPLQCYSSYLAKSWTLSKGCLSCSEGNLDLINKPEKSYPLVLMGVFIDRPTPFLELKLQRISELAYPKKKIFLFVSNKVYLHDSTVRRWINKNGQDYMNLNFIYASSKINISIGHVRWLAMKTCTYISCDVFFNVNSVANIENPDTLTDLVSHKKTVLAPMMTVPGSLRSTFWGAVSDDVYFRYIESFDYQNIINNKRRGIWNVPQVWHVFIVWNYMLPNPDYERALLSLDVEPDILISLITRISKKVSMYLYVMNLNYYGHLSNMEYVAIDNLHNDLWQVTSNSKDWEKTYLHSQFYENYEQLLKVNLEYGMKCPKIYIFPIFTEQFCKEIIETVESTMAKWPDQYNENQPQNRTDENTPSTGIYFNQIGYERAWNYIFNKYIKPVAKRFYRDIHIKGQYETGLVVRHGAGDPFEIKSPSYDFHNVQIALSKKGRDYEGDSLDFLLSGDCDVIDLPVGWAVLYPNSLIEFFQPEPIRKGVKYNILSRINS